METNKIQHQFQIAKYWPFIAFAGLNFNAFATGKAPDERPNIIIIMADDMGYSDIGCYGSEIATPNIDRLAANGVRFQNFYNNAKCCPSRASLLTGLYNHEAGMGNMVTNADTEIQPGPYQGFLNENCMTIGEVLRTNGYSTYMSGKWHVGERQEHWPLQRGFDKYFGLISGASSYFEIIKEPRIRTMAYGNKSYTPPTDGFYMTDAFSDSAVAFVNTHEKAGKDKPFFLYLAYTAPHWPLHALEEDIKKYDGKYDIGWDSLRIQRYKKMLSQGIVNEKHVFSPRTEGIPSWSDAEEKQLWIRRMQVYAAMIDRMDQGIGRLLETLENLNELDNTLILFLADNGGCAEVASTRNLGIPGIPVGEKGSYDSYHEPWANASNTPYRYYKNWLYEGGIRTPLVVSWPAMLKDKGQITPEVGHLTDILPTCIEVSGAKYPVEFNNHPIKKLRGKSLVPAFKGASIKRTEPIFWEYAGGKAMRNDNWKMVKKNSGKWELYDLKSDPTEMNDLSTSQTDRLNKMSAAYQEWEKEVGVRQVKAKK